MDLLRCTILSDNIPAHFYSADAAIGFLDKILEDETFFRGSIVVRNRSKEMEFRFKSQENMLESLMNL
ncbi:hypothetical protein [Photobacterium lipolyticum]|uniref:Uncharacterized protein n=1 Tax=Photobacterium lipolyticum TaxID=266810 RepID=A0A2T3MX29_9GAMM|nr:hypothetical protein [Photobacterium lipolyticum]PSW04397.1 hypothetical protein C9I89_13825 [Photobacterium lipolyticum]